MWHHPDDVRCHIIEMTTKLEIVDLDFIRPCSEQFTLKRRN